MASIPAGSSVTQPPRYVSMVLRHGLHLSGVEFAVLAPSEWARTLGRRGLRRLALAPSEWAHILRGPRPATARAAAGRDSSLSPRWRQRHPPQVALVRQKASEDNPAAIRMDREATVLEPRFQGGQRRRVAGL